MTPPERLGEEEEEEKRVPRDLEWIHLSSRQRFFNLSQMALTFVHKTKRFFFLFPFVFGAMQYFFLALDVKRFGNVFGFAP